MTRAVTWHRSPDVLWRYASDGLLATTRTAEHTWRFGVTGAVLWEALASAATTEQLAAAIRAPAEVPRSQVKAHLEDLLARMQDVGLVGATCEAHESAYVDR